MDPTAKTIESFHATVTAYERRFMDCSAYAPDLSAFCRLLPTEARGFDLGCDPGNVARFLLDLASAGVALLSFRERRYHQPPDPGLTDMIYLCRKTAP